MIFKRNEEEIKKMVALLEELGFIIIKENSDVEFNLHEKNTIKFDFSANACNYKAIVYKALSEAYKKGHDDGRNAIKKELKNILS